jgi:hypothetical protein
MDTSYSTHNMNNTDAVLSIRGSLWNVELWVTRLQNALVTFKMVFYQDLRFNTYFWKFKVLYFPWTSEYINEMFMFGNRK